MKDILIKKLHEYIRENNPDVLLQLEEEGKVTEYLSDKVSSLNALLIELSREQPAYIIEDTCMDELTQDLRPSKYNYICNILEEEFEDTFQRLVATGLLRFEAINIITHCQSVFEDLNFSEETEDNQFLRYAILGAISDYLVKSVTSENENVSNELQQSTKTEG